MTRALLCCIALCLTACQSPAPTPASPDTVPVLPAAPTEIGRAHV